MLELMAKRAALVAQAREALDAKDLDKYENFQADIDKLSREITAHEKQTAIEEAMKKVNERETEPTADEKKDQYSKLFYDAVRSNDFSQVRALSTSPDTAGGFLVAPATLDAKIREILMANVTMRKISDNILSALDKKIPIVTAFGAASWIDEDGSYGITDDTFASVAIGSYKVGKIVKISEELLQDNAFNIEDYLAKGFARVIGEAEETAFVTGDGSGKPTGVITGITAALTTASATAITADEVMDLFYGLKKGYRKNATFLMNDTTEKLLRKLKNATTGDYMWQPGMTAGQPNTLFGVPVETSDSMEAPTATKQPIVIGDFKQYMIKDTSGMSIQRLNELYAANGQVGFKGHLRTDGAKVIEEAFKSLKMKA